MEDSEQLDCNGIQSKNTLDHLNATVGEIQSLNIQKDSTFSCIQCAMCFMDETNFMLHLESIEHAVMVISSGFEEEAIENEGDSLPPLYCCLLCNQWFFDYRNYVCHLKGKVHKKMANYLKILLIRKKKLDVTDNGCTCVSKMSHDLYFPLHYCELCDVWEENCKYFNLHTESKSHKKINKFFVRMWNSNMEEILGTGSSSDSPIQTDYCRLCNIQFKGYKSRENHVKGKVHKKIELLMTKIVETKKENEFSTCLKTTFLEKSYKMLKCCEICHALFKTLELYNNHLKGTFHKRVIRLHMLMGDRDYSIKDKSVQPIPTSKDLAKLHSLAHHCKSCNIAFNDAKHIDLHLKSALHKQIEQLINKMHGIKSTMSTANISEIPDSDNVGSLLTFLYYCELCNSWSSARLMHSNRIHRAIEAYISNIDNKQVSDVVPPPFYCELCDIQLNNSEHYCRHAEGKFHKKVNSSVKRILNEK